MSDDFSDIVSVFAGGIRLAVKAKPGLRYARAPKLADIGNGKRALEITVAEAAEDGNANRAILEKCAATFGLKKADLTVKSGTAGRLKLIEISGDPVILRERIVRGLSQALNSAK